jgi:hypothetical protein
MSFSCHKPCGDQNNTFGHQLLVTTIGDQNLSIIHFSVATTDDQIFQSTQKTLRTARKKISRSIKGSH